MEAARHSVGRNPIRSRYLMSVTDSTTTSELVARAKAITERELAIYA